jgi:hypothetical protein
MAGLTASKLVRAPNHCNNSATGTNETMSYLEDVGTTQERMLLVLTSIAKKWADLKDKVLQLKHVLEKHQIYQISDGIRQSGSLKSIG